MLVEMKLRSDGEGRGAIELTLPSENLMETADLIRRTLTQAGHKVRCLDQEGEEWVGAEDVFPDGSPAMALRGLRVREGLTEEELASRLGTSAKAVSEMESGERPISEVTAARLGEAFGFSAGVFL